METELSEQHRQEQQLRWVRQELDILNHARMFKFLGLEDEERYQELCRIERRLLWAGRAE